MKAVIDLGFVESQSMASNYTSDAIDVAHTSLASVAAQWTQTVATLGGTLKLQASNDGSNWEDISGSSVTVSGSGSQLWNVQNVGYSKLRISWTQTGGDGTLDVQYITKGDI